MTDPALAALAKYAKDKWNVTVKTSALAAGTPVAYGQGVEWKGRPGADIFWGRRKRAAAAADHDGKAPFEVDGVGQGTPLPAFIGGNRIRNVDVGQA